MNDPAMNELFKWGIKNSDTSPNGRAPPPKPMTDGDREALQAILDGLKGESDATRMEKSMKVVDDDSVTAEDKYTAFKNFQMLIENLDNANNMESLGLWTHVIKHLENEDPELRMLAAWTCGTAVQNNIRTQERVSFAWRHST